MLGSRRLTDLISPTLLAAVLVLSAPAHAVSFTLQELFEGASFSIGSVSFENFAPIDGVTVEDPNGVTVETVENSTLFGFTVNGSLSGATQLGYLFDITQSDPGRPLTGAALYLTDFEVPESDPFQLGVGIIECQIPSASACDFAANPRPELVVELSEAMEAPIIVADIFAPEQATQTPIRIATELAQVGAVTTRSYATLFTVPIPEPATGLLCTLGLVGLAMARRHR